MKGRVDRLRGIEPLAPAALEVDRVHQHHHEVLLERIDDPAKQYKFNAGDIGERQRWDEYQQAYEEMIRGTATEYAPWYVAPADNKWFTRLVVAAAIVQAAFRARTVGDGAQIAQPGA